MESGRQKDRQTDRERERGRQTGREIDRHTDRQRQREATTDSPLFANRNEGSRKGQLKAIYYNILNILQKGAAVLT